MTQHLDDGTIHALLDGELTTDQAEALHEHVQFCPACADRLTEERLIQSEAERMIAELDAPVSAPARAVPPFEEAMAPEPILPEQPMASGPPVVLMPERDFERSRIPKMLGWAATLVVAAGAGYFASVARQPAPGPLTLPEVGVPQDAAGGTYLGDSMSFDSAAGGAFATSAEVAAPADSGGTAGLAAGRDAAKATDTAPLIIEESASEREPQAIVTPPPPAPAPRTTDEREARSEAARRRLPAREQDPAQERDAARAAPAESRTEAADTREDEAPRLSRSAPRPEPATPATGVGAAAGAPPGASPLEQQAQIRMRIGLDETQRMLGSPLHVIDGLQQQLVGLVDGRLVQGANPNAPVVRVVYLDDQRRPIYLDQQRLDTARRQMAVARDTVPPDWVKGDVWLSLKASMSAAELVELARRVR